MSYDFRLFKRQAGEDPLITARRESTPTATTPPDPRKEALKRKVADALVAHNPKLEVFQLGHEEIAKFEKISVEEARLKYRYVELTERPDGGSGMQITLYDDEASVTIPYWHGDARAAFGEIWNCLNIICRDTGYLVYDPQIEQIIDPSLSFDNSLACYSAAMRKIGQTLPAGAATKKPWWRFW